jgi:hypothetical protein
MGGCKIVNSWMVQVARAFSGLRVKLVRAEQARTGTA